MKYWPLLLTLGAPMALADWQLVGEESSLSFVSLKNVDVAEAHRFTKLSGSVAGDGGFEFKISADSVDTKIPIRDERLAEHVLAAGEHPYARVSGRVEPSELDRLRVGDSIELEIRAELQFREGSTPLAVPVQVSKVADGALRVVSQAPVLLSARVLGVADGVEALREIAGLESISMAVPVYFSLLFEQCD